MNPMVISCGKPNKVEKYIAVELECNRSYNCWHRIPLLDRNKGESSGDQIIRSILNEIILPNLRPLIRPTIERKSEGFKVVFRMSEAEPYRCSDDVLCETYKENWLEIEKARINAQNGIKE